MPISVGAASRKEGSNIFLWNDFRVKELGRRCALCWKMALPDLRSVARVREGSHKSICCSPIAFIVRALILSLPPPHLTPFSRISLASPSDRI